MFDAEQETNALRVPTEELKEARRLLRNSGCVAKRLQKLAACRRQDAPQGSLIPLQPGIDFGGLPKEIFAAPISARRERLRFRRTYQDFSTAEVLTRLLPSGVTVPRRFDRAGHVLRLRLRTPGQMRFRRLIGKVLMQKTPGVRTVVMSKGAIAAGSFRVFQLELLAGEDDLEVDMTEGRLRLQFNFGDVFWNSRLSYERYELASRLQSGDVVCDLAAGVGAFAVLAATKGCTVFANDLNPASAPTVLRNAALNNVTLGGAFVGCARDCIERLKGAPPPSAGAPGALRAHVVFKLPELALDFLDVFRRSLATGRAELFGGAEMELVVHFYGLAPAKSPEQPIKERVAASLGTVPEGLTIRRVRDVSPLQDEFCVEFAVRLAAAAASDESP